MVGVFRLIITVLLAGPFAYPALTVKVTDVKGPVELMYNNIIYPAAGASLFIMGGPVDWVIYLIESTFCSFLIKKRTISRVNGTTKRKFLESEAVKQIKLDKKRAEKAAKDN